MGHAGAVISGGADTAEAKIAAMRAAGIAVCEGPHLLGKTMKDLLASRRRPARAAARGAGRGAPASRARAARA
jgi:succinyl-CoA synthetase alpha subunit